MRFSKYGSRKENKFLGSFSPTQEPGRFISLKKLSNISGMKTNSCSHVPSLGQNIDSAGAPLVPLTYSVAETAAIVGVSEASVYRLLSKRLLKSAPGLRHKRIPRRNVHSYINGGIL